MTKFPKKTLRDLPIEGKIILLRADYNVPLLKDGTIDDDFRMTQSLPTVKYLLKHGCKVVICAHLGRPDGMVKPELSLEPVARHLGELLGQDVAFISESIGDQVIQAVKALVPSKVLLLENLRFHSGEEENDSEFAKLLAKSTGAHYFVQDGFGIVHRAHASTDAITHYLPSVGGLLLEREYVAITNAMNSPKRPLVAVLGGAKISDKIKVINRLVEIANHLIIGGAMANTFLAHNNIVIGKSVHEAGLDDIIESIYASIRTKIGPGRQISDFLTLPTDVAVAKGIANDQARIDKPVAEVQADEIILDIGPDSINEAVRQLSSAGTVIWNGTLGLAEFEQFSYGSARVALQLAQHPETVSVIGGGDTADFVLKWDALRGGSFSHVSTGGGASLDLMADEKMPGIEALMNW